MTRYYNNQLIKLDIKKDNPEKIRELKAKHNIFNHLNTLIADTPLCPICLDTIKQNSVTKCGHIVCQDCISNILKQKSTINCPICRQSLTKREIYFVKYNPSQYNKDDCMIIKYINSLLYSKNKKIIIIVKNVKFLRILSKLFVQYSIIFSTVNGSVYTLKKTINKWKFEQSSRILLLNLSDNITGLNLVEATNIILLDIDNKIVEKLCIGVSVRLGQSHHVDIKMLITNK